MDPPLEDSVMENFKVAAQIRQHTEKVSGIDFYLDGSKLISGSNDETVLIYDCINGKIGTSIPSKKYGVGIIKYGNACDRVIYTSTKINNDIRYLSLPQRSFIRYFSGHSEKVISLSSASSRETIISCSEDMTMKLWDARTPQFVGNLNLPGLSIASFDPIGESFVVGVNSEVVQLYDMRSFNRGPFRIFDKILKSPSPWTDLQYSSDGKTMLINTAGFIQTIDATSGALVQAFSDNLNSTGVPMDATFSSDSKYVLGGSTNGLLHIWNAKTAMHVTSLNSDRIASIEYLKFNPKFKMLITTSNHVVSFWLPMEAGDHW